MQEIRKVNVCFLYSDGSTIEITCEADIFSRKYGYKLREKNLVAYIKEFTDTDNISFFIKNAMGDPIDVFRLDEYGYLTNRRWKFSKVRKETFESYLSYMKVVNSDPGSRKFILKKIAMEIKE